MACMPFTDMKVHELDVNSTPTLYQMLSPRELNELSQFLATPHCDITSEGGQVTGMQYSRICVDLAPTAQADVQSHHKLPLATCSLRPIFRSVLDIGSTEARRRGRT